ncbi:hypothetical protein HanHA300_Chr13g0486381 [Helianthus annuus]|nr:hypothetical protein HanHA300_Chr13g0486381 [Helianthus annuus]KAJ0664095.1 hypothetical protein HanLR1_Chr13g0488361 [Helianthus annuus]
MKLLLRALRIFGRLVILMSFWMVIVIQVWTHMTSSYEWKFVM